MAECLDAAELPTKSSTPGHRRARSVKGLNGHDVAAGSRLRATPSRMSRAKSVRTRPGAFPLRKRAVLYVTPTRAARRGFTTHEASAI